MAADPKPTGLPGVTQDARARELFEALLESAPDAMVIVDQSGTIRLVNAQAERMFGYPRSELIGSPVELLIPERFRDRHLAHRADFTLDPRARPMGASLELSARRRDGSEFPVEISLGPLQTEEGVLTTAAVRDISERKAVERKLADYREGLERSNRELEQFAYVASHDLRAPLRTVTSFAQLLQSRYGGSLDSEADDYLHFIVQGASHMQSLIDGLLAFSRVGRGGGAFGPVPLEDVLQRVEMQLRATLAERQAQITHDPLPLVWGIELELVQLLQNLVVNALKFQPGPRPRVHVWARREGDFHEVAVRDWGIGIEPEHQERIFMIFQRLHAVERFEGTGIGLAICRKIVQHHGGRIRVESTPGAGATFYFTLKTVE